MSANVNRADPSSRRNILTIPGSTGHHGGQLQFGPDRSLYASTGDGNAGKDAANNAQNTDSLFGKVLRIKPLSGQSPPYAIPAGNPFVGIAGRDEIWAYGLRQPWRFSFDRATGDLALGDAGQKSREEIDFRLKGDPAGANFGWRCYEGTIPTPNLNPPCDPPEPADHAPPVFDYAHVAGSTCSGAIVGGYVVRDTSLGDLYGRYVYGDNCTGQLRSIKLQQPTATDDRSLGLSVPQQLLSSFGEDACGRVYVASLDGQVSRLQRGQPAPCPP